MKRPVVGAILLFVVVVAGAVGVKLLWPVFLNYQQKTTSDAVLTKAQIRIALDNWIGYFPLRSPEMKRRMREAGYLLVIEDDEGDYAGRMHRLNGGEIDMAVATVDSYLINGAAHDYPGTIVAVIDESRGGDAILARTKRVDSLDSLKGKTDIRVAYTPNSPSHHLLKSVADHFNIPQLLPSEPLQVLADGSGEAMKKLLSGAVDVAVCWEPDVTKALNTGEITKLLGTEDTRRLIVDILIVNRNYQMKHPKIVSVLLRNYFLTLRTYRQQPALLVQSVKDETHLAAAEVTAMLNGVAWAGFTENCEDWFGISVTPGIPSEEGIIETIESTTGILVGAGDFAASPIPDQNPYRLTNRSFLEEIGQEGGWKGEAGKKGVPTFAALSPEAWEQLRPIGALKVDPILFRHGTTDLTDDAKAVLDQIAGRLSHYPNFRIVIRAHTDVRGEKAENQQLSQDRADAVAHYLQKHHQIHENRIFARGYGGSRPLAQLPGEPYRAWLYRLPRVELVLVREEW